MPDKIDKKEAEKIRQRAEKRQRYFEHLDRRIPELHRKGYCGRTARTVADKEWASRG